MECVTIAPLMRAGRVIPVGTTIDLPPAKYEQLRASGSVRAPAEHAVIVSAEEEATAILATANRAAEAARERATADAAAEAELAKEAAEAAPESEATGDPATRRTRRQR